MNYKNYTILFQPILKTWAIWRDNEPIIDNFKTIDEAKQFINQHLNNEQQ